MNQQVALKTKSELVKLSKWRYAKEVIDNLVKAHNALTLTSRRHRQRPAHLHRFLHAEISSTRVLGSRFQVLVIEKFLRLTSVLLAGCKNTGETKVVRKPPAHESYLLTPLGTRAIWRSR